MTASDLAGAPKRTVMVQGFRVELDLSSQVLAIEVPEPHGFGDGASGEAPLAATLGQLDLSGPVSAAALAQKAKIFDDGLYAAVELAAQEGAGRHAGKAALLASLGHALARADADTAGDAGAVLLAAARLGEVALPDLPPAVETRVQRAVEDFLADELRSKPIGFYTWSGRLASVFQQDRMLQTELGKREEIETLVDALRADPSARATYERHLRLVSRLTNPFAQPDLRDLLEARDRGPRYAPAPGTAFLPQSVSHETAIVKKLYGDAPIPEGFVLADAIIGRIATGQLDLAPRPESGWYDYQTWALEPLVVPGRMPEAARLELDKGYRRLLLELFKGLLTLTRETHVKQLESVTVGAALGGWEPCTDIAPALAAEPLATFYLRRALGYRFLRGVLEEAFGPGRLEQMKRLTPDGACRTSLAEELTDIEQLFVGAHATVARQLGMGEDAAAGDVPLVVAAANRFEAWARDPTRDLDLGQDVRAMVPVFYDVLRKQTKVWAFLGWSQRPVSISFARPPDATVLDREGRAVSKRLNIRWGALLARPAYPVMAELYVDRILNRAEFRHLCDSCRTRAEILRRLGAADAGPAGRDEEVHSRRARCVCAQCGWEWRWPSGDPRPDCCPRCGGPLLAREE